MRKRKNILRPCRYIFIGLALMLLASLPVIMDSLRAFHRLGNIEAPEVSAKSIELAFHPFFLACGGLGLVFVVPGVFCVLFRVNRSKA